MRHRAAAAGTGDERAGRGGWGANVWRERRAESSPGYLAPTHAHSSTHARPVRPFSAQGDYAVGQVFLPKDPILYDQAKKVIHQVRRWAWWQGCAARPCCWLCSGCATWPVCPQYPAPQVAANQGHDLLGWRHVPTDNSSLGPSAVGGIVHAAPGPPAWGDVALLLLLAVPASNRAHGSYCCCQMGCSSCRCCRLSAAAPAHRRRLHTPALHHPRWPPSRGWSSSLWCAPGWRSAPRCRWSDRCARVVAGRVCGRMDGARHGKRRLGVWWRDGARRRHATVLQWTIQALSAQH